MLIIKGLLEKEKEKASALHKRIDLTFAYDRTVDSKVISSLCKYLDFGGKPEMKLQDILLIAQEQASSNYAESPP